LQREVGWRGEVRCNIGGVDALALLAKAVGPSENLLCTLYMLVVVVYILRPVEPKARLPKGIGRPAAYLAYVY
jgi:hypothetical protein